MGSLCAENSIQTIPLHILDSCHSSTTLYTPYRKYRSHLERAELLPLVLDAKAQ